ncbi:molecular chaperone TorD family protein [Adlercreutzia sp. ZJ473]|uniref:molecular chaperone TorD family protein n=1 Tax=Adlercreutzia sp. ZJ473 TaxID=2722822 RepID=UPI0020A62C77|nr:molecular chaperone TorD family protein [Adlercreutzia sp. ZJ473]
MGGEVLCARPMLAAWMAEYDEIGCEYVRALADQGIDLVDRAFFDQAASAARDRLRAAGAIVRNGGASVLWGSLSPACEACTGEACSQTFFLSLACNRSCYYCFNRNQVGFKESQRLDVGWKGELDSFFDEHPDVACVGLTGGEPLLHADEAVAFLAHARHRAPRAHLRIYTAGDFLDESLLARLADAGLDELRLSVKLEPDEVGAGGSVHLGEVDEALRRARLAQRYVPHVMVEMPAIPGTGVQMRALLRGLDEMGAFGINLLEFGYPMGGWPEFARRGLAVASPPFAVPYDYAYAGGLPVARSELMCLELLEYAVSEGLSLGVHYCSLENKNRSQIRQQNAAYALDERFWEMDAEDFFWKTAKAFDADVPVVCERLDRMGMPYRRDGQDGSVMFHVRNLPGVVEDGGLGAENVFPIVSYNVAEPCAGGFAVRELKIEPWGWEKGMGVIGEAWTARAAACELLALTLRYPSTTLAEAVASGEWLDATCEIASALGLALPEGFGAGLPGAEGERAGAGCGSLGSGESASAGSAVAGSRPAPDAEELLRALRPEATRLFVGAPEPACSPYEGVWRARAEGVPALLFVNPHSMEVERFCRACGLGRPEGTNEPLDHVATELELMCRLAAQAAGEVVEDGLPGGSPTAAYDEFLNEHALAWMPGFATRLAADARHPLYVAAAQFLGAFVGSE